MQNECGKIGYIASCLAVLYPFLDYYGFGNVSLSFFLTIVLLVHVFKKRGYIGLDFPTSVIWFILYFCLMRFVCNIKSLNGIVAPSIIYIFILLGFLIKEVNFEKFLKLYRIAVFVNILFLLIQECLYQVSGYRIIGIITALPLTLGDANFDPALYEEQSSFAERSSAFFSEPAHFVQFLLPLLIIELFYIKTKAAYMRCIAYIMALFLLSSGNALLGMSIILLFFVVRILKSFHPILSIVFALLFLSVAVVSVSYILTTEYGEKLEERSEELDSDQVKISSGFIRIFRGYYVWDEMDLKEKIFGLHSQVGLEQKIRQCSVALAFGDNDWYLNSVQTLLIHTGYVGTLIFLWLLLYLWRGNNLAGRCCILTFVSLGFVASLLFSYTMVLYLLIALKMKQKTSNYSLRYMRIGVI